MKRQVMKSQWFVCMGLLIATAAFGQTYTDNVVIVLDGSGSMDQQMGGRAMRRIDAAKSALNTTLSQIPKTTHVGLLVFSKTVKRPWVYDLSARDDVRLAQAIDSIEPGGGTPLGEFMKIAANRLLQERENQFGYGTYRLLIVTDGEANDAHLVDQFAPSIIERGITVDVIGVDMHTSHTLAKKAHSYRSANDPASLERAIREVFAEVSNEGGDGMAADEFELLEGIPLEIANAMVEALAKPVDNSPIVKKNVPQHSSGNNSTMNAPQRGQSSSSTGGGFFLKPIIFLIIILAVLMKVVLSAAKRG